MGSNIGTTSTGLIASLGMKPAARATAAANLLFDAAGVLIYFPFLRSFSRPMVDWFGAGNMCVAWAHLIFNVTVGLAFLLLLDRVEPILSRRFGVAANVQQSKSSASQALRRAIRHVIAPIFSDSRPRRRSTLGLHHHPPLSRLSPD
jgi:phosphate:Na+ symporter